MTVAEPDLPDSSIADEDDEPPRWTLEVKSRDLARWVFLAYLVVAVPVLLAMGSSRWFLGDEWTFLSAKSATSLHDLFQPHNQHWSTIPLIIYKVMYSMFGLHEYWPYQLLVILAHLVIAGLLRVIMRRCGVGPWIATVVAGTYVLFGPGSDDILWAFQIGFTLSLVFGLGQMIAADHEGPLTRRDWCGLGLGGLALLTSGQAPSVILATGLAVWWRRGWRQAAFHTVPLGIIYSIWYVWAGASLQTLASATGVTLPHPGFGDVTHFLWVAALGAFKSLGHFTVVDLALVGLFGLGCVLAWRSTEGRGRSRRLAMPGALLIGAMVGMAAAAPERFWISPDEGAASRYVGVSVAMILPILAVAGDAVIRRWRVAAPLVFALFLIAVPWNISSLRTTGIVGPAYYRSLRTWVGSLPYYPGFDRVPAWVEPNSVSAFGTPDLTVGWLRQAARDGRLPPRGTIGPIGQTIIPVQLGVAAAPGPIPAGLSCHIYHQPLAISPQLGDTWQMGSDLQVSLGRGTQAAGLAAPFQVTTREPLLKITLPDLHLLVTAPAGQTSFRLCT